MKARRRDGRRSPSPHRSSRWGEGRGEGQEHARTAGPIAAHAAANAMVPQSPHVHLPLTLTLSPRREERRGERGRALPRRRGGRSSPSPHRSSRWGEGRGEGQEHARTAGPIAAHAAAPTMVPQRPHVLLPLTLTLSPRREERRGERGRALPRRRDGRSSPSPHRSSRWGEGRGEGQEHARTAGPIAAHAAANAMVPQSPHVHLPLTLTLSPRREERRGERGRALPPRRGGRPSPSPHRSSRWGEGRGEGQEHARTAGPIAAHAAARAIVPQRPHVLLPLTLTLSPRREERRGERGRALPRRRAACVLGGVACA